MNEDEFLSIVEPAEELDRILEPHQIGQLNVWPETDGWSYGAAVRTELDESRLQCFIEWGVGALNQLNEVGDPNRLGWFPSQTGGWYMTCAEYDLPPDPEFD